MTWRHFADMEMQRQQPQFESRKRIEFARPIPTESAAMSAVVRMQQKISESSAKNTRRKEAPENNKMRVHVHADTVFLQERLARALGSERTFEVVVEAEIEIRRGGSAAGHQQKEILVMFSTGLVLEDLHRINGWRMALPGVRVLLIGGSQQEADFLQYIRSGIRGYLPADAGAKEITNTVQALGKGEAVCGGAQCALLCGYLEKEAETFPSATLHRDLGLTRREQQLIPLLTRGLTNKEIASHFSLSEQTVKNHLYRMKRKVGASGRLEIVDLCRQHGFLA